MGGWGTNLRRQRKCEGGRETNLRKGRNKFARDGDKTNLRGGRGKERERDELCEGGNLCDGTNLRERKGKLSRGVRATNLHKERGDKLARCGGDRFARKGEEEINLRDGE